MSSILTRGTLRSLVSLKKLALQSNRLVSMDGLQQCTALEELYLSHNGIRCIQASHISAIGSNVRFSEMGIRVKAGGGFTGMRQ
jgi:Leucine-rich repeat (LRR) protein